MEFWQSIGPFLLAVVAVIINGVPQLLYAQARGFALKPAGFAYLVGAIGNLLTGSVTPISGQAETITVASVKKRPAQQRKLHPACRGFDDYSRPVRRRYQNC